ncbi:MAG: CDP-alcohol phosphatidyltransferase family protein [Clostridia bacterium]|nr:CDP-alcohol phosphatidyltransferase family protein [Clostridia bacterium]
MKSDSGQQLEKTVFGSMFTIPNMMSFFRLILIPFILWFYLGLHNVWLTVIFVVISALTDILDGWVARRFNMVSEFGKFIDPVADKFTQGSLILCLIPRYPLVIALLVLFLVREIAMVFTGTLLIKKTDKFSSSKWFGKVNTVIVETVVMVLLVFVKIPKNVADILICVCMFSVVASMILYLIYYKKLFDEAKANQSEPSGTDPGTAAERQSAGTDDTDA